MSLLYYIMAYYTVYYNEIVTLLGARDAGARLYPVVDATRNDVMWSTVRALRLITFPLYIMLKTFNMYWIYSSRTLCYYYIMLRPGFAVRGSMCWKDEYTICSSHLVLLYCAAGCFCDSRCQAMRLLHYIYDQFIMLYYWDYSIILHKMRAARPLQSCGCSGACLRDAIAVQ